jgi:hypothetical protein
MERETNENPEVEKCLRYGQILTGIDGLDKLFYEEGLQLPPNENKPLSIVIHGGGGVSKSLLAMQLLYGITKSIRNLFVQKYPKPLGMPIFLVEDNIENVEDMFLDYIISKSIKQITEDKIKGYEGWVNNSFAFKFFEEEDCGNYFGEEKKSIDKYISQGIIKYNSQKNSLEMAFGSHEKEIVANRKNIKIEKLNTENKFIGNEAYFNDELFPIRILNYYKDFVMTEKEVIPCIVTKGKKLHDEIDKIIKEKKLKVLVLINIFDESEESQLYNSDLKIEMRSFEEPEEKYFVNQIRISRCILQTAALGWHRYKKRDYGIEVYPSIHVLLQQINHMPQSLLQSSYGILCKTDNVLPESKDKKCVPNDDTLNRNKWNSLELLYDSFRSNLNVNRILDDLFINPSSYGKCTAIIGTPNTYKRFFAMGAAFSGCLRGEHTLDILFEKDYNIMSKRIVCPAMAYNTTNNIINYNCKKITPKCYSCNEESAKNDSKRKECKIRKCYGCYDHIHFKSIRMGYISSDEFLYYLIEQIKLSKKSQKIKRIIIDDLQVLDYSFPSLKKDKLFLTALISICKENEIDLFILCDKNASKAQELRGIADNVICTEKKDNDVCMYIEKFYSYNEPSHIYGLKISNIKDLFYCDTKHDVTTFTLNAKYLEEIVIPSMEDYWVDNNTNKIIRSISKTK